MKAPPRTSLGKPFRGGCLDATAIQGKSSRNALKWKGAPSGDSPGTSKQYYQCTSKP